MNELSYLNIRKPCASDVANLAVFVKALQDEYAEMERAGGVNAEVNYTYFQIPGSSDLAKYYNRLNRLGEWVNHVNGSPWKAIYLVVDPTKEEEVFGIFSIIEDFNDDDYRSDGAIALCVSPAHRCKGIGRYIMNYCRGYFGEMGRKSFEVACDECDVLVKVFLESFESITLKGGYKVGPYEMLRYTVDSNCNRNSFR